MGVVLQVTGQTTDLQDLQRILMRSQTKLSAQQQQNITVGRGCVVGGMHACRGTRLRGR